MAGAIHAQLRAAGGAAVQAVLFGSLLPPSPWTAPIQIQQRIRAAFLAAPALADGNLRVNRDAPLSPRESAGLRLYIVASEAQEPALLSAPVDWTTTWRVDCLARADSAGSDIDPTEAADGLLRAAYARARALRLDDLAVMDLHVGLRIRWECEEADRPVCSPHFFIQVQHRCDPDTLQPV